MRTAMWSVALVLALCATAMASPMIATEDQYGCLDTPAAIQCAVQFSQCDNHETSVCGCFAAMRTCFEKAGCGTSTLRDMATQCTTAQCPASVCGPVGTDDDEASDFEGVSAAIEYSPEQEDVAEDQYGCLNSPAAIQCAAEFSQCDNHQTSVCGCFSALRTCFEKAGCGTSTLRDMATQCTTAQCPASVCGPVGTDDDEAVSPAGTPEEEDVAEDQYGCLNSPAAIQCAAEFSQCDNHQTSVCGCFSALRTCFEKAGCGTSTLRDMATQCTTAQCPASVCGPVGTDDDEAVSPAGATEEEGVAEDQYGCLNSPAAIQCAAEFSQCDNHQTSVCGCFSALRTCYEKAGCGTATLRDMATQCTTAQCPASVCGPVGTDDDEADAQPEVEAMPAIAMAAGSNWGCLDTEAAMQCAVDFSDCDNHQTSVCTCFATLRSCFSAAKCGIATLKDMATQCTTAQCPSSVCGAQLNLRGSA